MQSEEPSTCLVNTLIDEVGGECLTLVYHFLVLKRIVNLCVRHRTRVKPYVDEVALALHRFTALAHEHDVVNIRAMEVDLVIVLLRIITGNKSFVFQWIALHHSGSYGLFNLVVEFLHTSNALLLTVLIAPDRQRSTPIARAREIPVVEVLKPVAETSCTS